MAQRVPQIESTQSSSELREILSSLSKQSEVLFFSYSPSRRALTYHTENLESVLGVKPQLVALDAAFLLRHLHEADRFEVLTALEAALRGDSPFIATYRWTRPDTNELHWLHCRAALRHPFPPQSREASLDGIIVEADGPIKTVQAKESLLSEAAYYWEKAPFSTFLLSEEFRVITSNTRSLGAHKIDGYDCSALTPGRLWTEFFPTLLERDTMQRHLQALLEGQSELWDERLPNSALRCLLFPLSRNGTTIGVCGVLLAIEKEVNLEQSLASLRKGEALRSLAAHAAHNFTNTLQVIVGQASAISAHPEQRILVSLASAVISENAQRAANLAHQLLELDAPGRRVLRKVDLNLAAVTALNRVPLMFTSGFKVSVVFGTPRCISAREEDLVGALADWFGTLQERLSLGQELIVETRQLEIEAGQVEELAAGNYAKLRLVLRRIPDREQSGSRVMNNVTAPQDLEPNTKLRRLEEVVQELGGAVQRETAETGITAISAYFPLAEEPRSRPIERAVTERSPAEILIVDDDRMVLETVSAVLCEAGYSCATAADLPHAIKVANDNEDSLRLVLVDVILPEADAATLVRKLKRFPKQPTVVGFSGAGAEHASRLLAAGATQIIEKPIDPRRLKAAIREILLHRRM